ARFGSHPFLIHDDTLGRVSYTDLLRFCRSLDRQLTELGVPVGAYVGTIFHNCGLAALLFLAVIATRRVLVPLNPSSSKAEIDYMLGCADCTAVIFDPSHTKTSDFGVRRSIAVSDHHRFFTEQCTGSGLHGADPGDSAEAPRFCGEVVFTSGSTGR